jgi:radical SAM superfamily enzyme YgiQ (UPF0313 family)
MKVLLTTLNSKYIHTSLAVYTLQAYAALNGIKIDVQEFTINQELNWILSHILREEPDLVGFSCNIWNIEAIHSLCWRLKSVRPGVSILLGGPEITPEPIRVLRKSRADMGIIGEGEDSFYRLINALELNDSLDSIPGLVWREGEHIRWNAPGPPLDLDKIPFPYPEQVLTEPGRLIYYETSRGCPFSCAYCLSGSERGVRYLNLKRVFADLQRLVAANVRQVKFVDRTFNTDPSRTAEILRHIIEYYKGSKTNFHLELVADILNDECIDLLSSAPPGLFRAEVGIQSLHPPTLAAIGRKNHPEKLEANLRCLMSTGHVPVHLDLIAGLPEEGIKEFARTFDWTYRLNPPELQLGILKLLKASELGRKGDQLGYVSTQEAPYEVLSSAWLTFAELDRIKTVAHLVDLFHNSGHFRHTLPYLCTDGERSPFAVFLRMADLWQESFGMCSHALRELFLILLGFLPELITDPIQVEVAKELLRLDRIMADWGFSPSEGWGELPDFPDILKEMATDQQWVERYLPEVADLASGDRRRRIRRWRLKIDPRDPTGGITPTDILAFRPVEGRIGYRVWDELALDPL